MINEFTYPISLKHISYWASSYDGPRPIISDLSLDIHRGEWLSLVGTNGSGKSTLAKVIAGIYPVSSGTLTYEIEENPPVQFVFQNPDLQIIGENVYEEVCFGMDNFGVKPARMHERAMEALTKVGLSQLTDRPTSQLSGGQKQLLAIAGCLAVNPAVLLFDEATSMLDPLSRKNIIEVAQELHREGKTIVWITQLLDELACSDRIVALDEGSIVFEGSKEQFFYGTGQGNFEESGCERLGFKAPYTIQVAQLLLKQGCQLNPMPFTPDQLSEAVRAIL
jgi:energy-coupling factor transport system ATP-binding protein